MISNKPHLTAPTTPQPTLEQQVVMSRQFVNQPNPFQQERTPFSATRLVMRPEVNQCFDLEAPNSCRGWAQFCGFNLYVQQFCRRTCRFC
ncbi:hypothetical protein L596_022607 [Steinernema carpocapsae]|uniref:ShKT domain-containing protein n=1 Tax=Steinernema carpocapsae TaxID=34508 RepID=A0A4U5MML4_STECR|nr:hypothetical protein L596_022607 [Steinernema carpocapsae]